MRLYERFADQDFHTSIATTFGIDFDAYEGVVLPRLRGAGCRNNIVIADGRMLTHALDGASALPRHAGKLYTVAAAHAAGVFHPKLFLQLGRRRGRIIVSSANLTTPGLAGNLELAGMIACEDSASGEQQLIGQAFAYLKRFADDRTQPGISGQLNWMLERTPWLPKAATDAPLVVLTDGTSAALLTTSEPIGIGRRFVELVDDAVSRLVVVSPYWDFGLQALSRLADSLSPGELCVLLDPGSASFPKQALNRVAGARLYDRGDFRKGRFIHAKLVIAQTEKADHVLLGSANCTEPALGIPGNPGSNEEVCLYRRLPPGTAAHILGLDSVLVPQREIDPAELPTPQADEELPLDDLSARTPGTFECRGDTLIWRPATSYDPTTSTVKLFDKNGASLPCRLSSLPGEEGAARYQISDAQDYPAFAKVEHGEHTSAPAIVTLIEQLRASVGGSSSRAGKALRDLDQETEASLLLIDVLNLLETLEQNDNATRDPLSIARVRPVEETAQSEYKTLSYEQFIAGRRKRTGIQISHSSLAGSDVSLIRKFLNRIIGLATGDASDDTDDLDGTTNPFDMGDETGDAEGALGGGEEFDTERTQREEEDRLADERRRAAARKMTRDHIAAAVNAFRDRIKDRRANGGLDSNDLIRIRGLLMVICTAGHPQPASRSTGPQSRLQVLPVEGDSESWPMLIGRTLFQLFGGNQPAIQSLHLSNEHDQLPDDVIECWATCYWCLQACLNAPLSAPERKRLNQFLKPLAERVYHITLPTKEELLGEDVIQAMEAMSANYGKRLVIDPETIVASHRALVAALPS